MALNMEEYVRGLRYQDALATDKNVDFDGTLNVEGAATLQSTLAVTGAITATGGVVGDVTGTVTGGSVRTVESVSADNVLTASESGSMFVDVKGSATTTFTLPAAAAGLTFTFVCGDAAGEILITPQTGDAIVTKADPTGASVAPAAGTGIKNTAASNVVGDHITLVALDATTWYTVAQGGTWASQ